MPADVSEISPADQKRHENSLHCAEIWMLRQVSSAHRTEHNPAADVKNMMTFVYAGKTNLWNGPTEPDDRPLSDQIAAGNLQTAWLRQHFPDPNYQALRQDLARISAGNDSG